MVSGMDCIWTDMEHVGNDWAVIERQILAAKAYDVDLLVRVSRGGYSDYIRPLEMDASGIMIPHVMSLEEAKKAVYNTKFHPVGRRPLDGGNADGYYTNLGLQDYMRQANEQRFTMLQIEDPEPLDELEEIVALPGVDIVFFGPGDFSQGIGAPGEWDHPKLTETRRLVAELALKHGKFAGTVGSVGNMEELISLGYRFISIGADVVGISEYYNNLFHEISGKQAVLSQGIYSGR
jgi:4-hydroxy-2-oxoheptanedioate aldolase